MNKKNIIEPNWRKVCSLWSAGVLLAMIPTGVLAQEGSDLELFWDPAELIVSATRTPKKLSRAPALATIVTAEQIRRMGAATLLDVVRRYPGFGVSLNNMGNQVIDVRGLRSYHGEKVLIMIDGHRVNEAHSGGTAWTFSDMTLDNVERIELIRGPGSALYGENAFAGVINVMTRRYTAENEANGKEAQGDKKNFVSVGGGTEQTGKASLLYGNRGEDWAATGFAHLYKTDGPELEVRQDVLSLNPMTAPFSLAPQDTEDWKEKQDVDLWLAKGEISLHSRYLHKRQGPYIGITDTLTDGSTRDNDSFFTELKWNHTLAETSNVEAKLYFDHHEFANYWVGYPPGFLGIPEYAEQGLLGEPAGKFQTYGMELLSDLQPAESHMVTTGAGYRIQRQFDIRYWANFITTMPFPYPLPDGFQEVSSWGNWGKENRENNWYLFAQDDWTISEVLSLVGGLRYDDYEEFDGVFSPRLGLIWEANGQTTFKLLYGHAFRAPSYVERFTINNPAYVGTPDLEPEIIDTVEGSVVGTWFGMNWDLGVYYSKYKDIIVLGEKSAPTSPAPYVNRDEATAKGVEVALGRQLTATLSAQVNYTYQNIENDETDSPLPGVAEHQANVEVQWEVLPKTFVNANLHWSSERERSSTDSREALDGYELVNVALLVQDFGMEGLELRLAVNNLLDEEYADPAPENTIYYDFPRPGITALLELKYSF
jgi:iron complex outermembrane receptor protein